MREDYEKATTVDVPLMPRTSWFPSSAHTHHLSVFAVNNDQHVAKSQEKGTQLWSKEHDRNALEVLDFRCR